MVTKDENPTTETIPCVMADKVNILSRGLNLVVQSNLKPGCIHCAYKNIHVSVSKFNGASHMTTLGEDKLRETMTIECCSLNHTPPVEVIDLNKNKT